MIIGISLVIDDISKGQKLVFRYPSKKHHLSCASGKVDAQVAAGLAEDFHNIDSDTFAKLFRPRSILCNDTLEVVIDQIRFVSHPTEVKFTAEQSKTGSVAEHRDIIFFNVVIAMTSKPVERESSDSGATQRTRVDQIKMVARSLAVALLHEEKRTNYVSQEAKRMLHIREQMHPETQRAHGAAGQSQAVVKPGQIDDTELLQKLLESSQLARDLQQVYDGLADGMGSHVMLHSWISLSFRTVFDGEILQWSSLQPYQTLLLVEDEAVVLADLPPGSSPQLRRLIGAANPLRSFEELATDLELPLAQVYQLSSHLVYWERARIIDTIAQSNIYQVKPQADLSRGSRFHAAFQEKFPRRSLWQVLSYFGDGRSLQEVMKTLNKGQHLPFLHMLVWLLQHSYLQQLHEYLVLAVPSPDYLQRLDDGSRMYQLLVRLVQHCCGDPPKHLREVIWAYRLDHGEVAEVLALYAPVLVTCLRP